MKKILKSFVGLFSGQSKKEISHEDLKTDFYLCLGELEEIQQRLHAHFPAQAKEFSDSKFGIGKVYHDNEPNYADIPFLMRDFILRHNHLLSHEDQNKIETYIKASQKLLEYLNLHKRLPVISISETERALQDLTLKLRRLSYQQLPLLFDQFVQARFEYGEDQDNKKFIQALKRIKSDFHNSLTEEEIESFEHFLKIFESSSK